MDRSRGTSAEEDRREGAKDVAPPGPEARAESFLSGRHWPAGGRWAAIAAATWICIHRVTAFRPLPFDAPGTVRPPLYSWFRAYTGLFARTGDAWFAWHIACYAALLIVPALALLNYFRRGEMIGLSARAGRILCSGAVFWLAYGVCLTLCRYPVIITRELNPDEGEFLAAAFKLFYDPNYFHAADCNTSGPGNMYPLMWPAVLGLSPDFASGRILAAAAIFFSVYLLYRSVRLVASDELARIAILPIALAYPAFTDSELVYNSSEHIPFLLLSLALFLSVRIFVRPGEYRLPIYLIGVIASVAFFAKLQSLPIAMVAGFAPVAFLATRGGLRTGARGAILFAAGGLTPMLVNAYYCLKAGVWNDFVEAYILRNFDYVDSRSGLLDSLRAFFRYVLLIREARYLLIAVLVIACFWLCQKARADLLWRWKRPMLRHAGGRLTIALCALIAAGTAALTACENRLVWKLIAGIYLIGGLAALAAVCGYFALRYRRGTLGADPVGWYGFLALLSSGAAFYCIYAPHRLFVHYVLFLFIPLGMLMAWMILRRPGATALLPCATAALAIACATYLWHFRDSRVFDVPEKVGTPDGDFIRSVTTPGGRIYVWGWAGLTYLSSARIPAARETQIGDFFAGYYILLSPPEYHPTPASERMRAYYMNRELRELEENPPELFVDAIGPASWFLTSRKYYGFEQFPAFKNFVDSNYVHVKDAYEKRFFLRRDLAFRVRGSGADSQPAH